METVEAWRQRKQEEIDRIAARLSGGERPVAPADATGVVEVKLDLRARLMSERTRRDPNLVDTNRLEVDARKIEDFSVAWRYQRFDMSVQGPLPYPGLMDDRASVWMTEWASSGMGAIAGVALGMQLLEERVHVLVRHDVYFETRDVLRDIARGIERTVLPAGSGLEEAARAAREAGAEVVVWWGDSYSGPDPRADADALDPALVDHVVFDTTCYEASSPRVRHVVDTAIERGVPVVLVRSHLKLDFLGVEWARLGSAVHVSSPFLSKERFARYRTLGRASGRCRIAVGATAVPLHLNPFLGDPAFHALNQRRVARILEANARFADGMRAAVPGLGVRTFHHGLFVSLALFDREVGPAVVREVGEALVAELRRQGLGARFANSFGFDFAAFAPFRHPVTDVDELRLAVPDWPDPWVDALVERIAAHLTKASG